MSHAPNYTPSTSFATDETNQVAGRSTVKTVSLDIEHANISAAINGINTNLKKLQRDDGKVKDFLIDPYAFSEQTRALLAATGIPRGVWGLGVSYNVSDIVDYLGFAFICLSAHTSSATFQTDLWIGISGDGTSAASAVAAQASEAAALASKNSAISSAASAAINEANSSASALVATNKATEALNSALGVGNQLTLAQAAAVAASASESAALSSKNSASSSAAAALVSQNAAAQSAIDAAFVSIASPTHNAIEKTAPVDADELPLVDSAASWGLKKLTWANLKAVLAAACSAGWNAATSTTATNQANGTVSASAIGYTVNGSVTQVTSKSTSVTLNAKRGTVTTHNAALAAGAEVSFTMINSALSYTTGTIIALVDESTNYSVSSYVRGIDGDIQFLLRNRSAGSLSEAVVIKFALFD